jgi:hypothetical protein
MNFLRETKGVSVIGPIGGGELPASAQIAMTQDRNQSILCNWMEKTIKSVGKKIRSKIICRVPCWHYNFMVTFPEQS